MHNKLRALALALILCRCAGPEPVPAVQMAPPGSRAPVGSVGVGTAPSAPEDSGVLGGGVSEGDGGEAVSGPLGVAMPGGLVDAVDGRSDEGVAPSMGQVTVLNVDGRAVTVYIPGLDPGTAVPVLFSLHGLSIPAIVMADVTGLPALADREGFVAVFPEGAGGTWNTGGATCGLGAFVSNSNDDVAFTQRILTEIEKLQAIDRTRVFMSGFSMGGYGTNHLVCQQPGLFRAGAAAAGGRTPAACQGPAPILLFHGTSDGTIAYDCALQARAAWAVNNGCSTEVDTVDVAGGNCEWSRGCSENGQVVLCTFEGMGHGWAGSVNPFALGGPQFESATELMWDFFETYL